MIYFFNVITEMPSWISFSWFSLFAVKENGRRFKHIIPSKKYYSGLIKTFQLARLLWLSNLSFNGMEVLFFEESFILQDGDSLNFNTSKFLTAPGSSNSISFWLISSLIMSRVLSFLCIVLMWVTKLVQPFPGTTLSLSKQTQRQYSGANFSWVK